MDKLEDISIQFVKGVGPAKAELFRHLGVNSVEDMMYFFPKRYEDRRNLKPIAEVELGEWQTITGVVERESSRKSWHTKKHVSEVVLKDDSGKITCIWFNQPYVSQYLRMGKRVVCYGKVDRYKDRLQMVAPEYELIEDETDEALKRIVPVYPLTKGISQRYLRKITKACINKYKDQLVDELPVKLRNKYKLFNIKRSIEYTHFPNDPEDQELALKRISFEEFFFFQVSVQLRRFSIRQTKGVEHRISDAQTLKFMDSFSFDLTRAQKNVLNEIKTDMSKVEPMLRLLQGDVGSGKTLIAIYGCYVSFLNGCQSAFMAPTEILARQHYENILELIELGHLGDIRVALLVSSNESRENNALYQKINKGEVDLVIGTHALINEEVKFKNISFVVIDEQHKFGVQQRALLTDNGSNPDILIMTATPIPRTLCLSLYGDLDLSIIDELPKNRGAIKTKCFIHDQSTEVYKRVVQEIKKGRQAYIVYPLIEESSKLDVKSAQEMFKRFRTKEFKDFKCELIHSQIKEEKATKIMMDFKAGKIDVLVATSILEVGVDVANANIMVIEHAERFGLAQLHQLRGRVGRGEHDSYCYLISDPTTEEGKLRLKAIEQTQDGFKIAQEDLAIRGPGRFFGRHQHGLNELRVANPATQIDLLELTRDEAHKILKDDPVLSKKDNMAIKKVIFKRYPTFLQNIKAG